MKIVDIILAAICTETAIFLLGDILKLPIYVMVLACLFFPLIAVAFLIMMYLIGRKVAVVFQISKHLMVGAFATVIDLKFFEFLSAVVIGNLLVAKSISFLFSTAIKYAGNKYWAFEKHGRQDVYREAARFLFITLIGLLIDVGVFYYATKVLGPQFGVSVVLWTKLCVILAAIGAALWNFFGYKFLVFKK